MTVDLREALTEELDHGVRRYAVFLSMDQGEDAYHNCVVDILERGGLRDPRCVKTMLVVAVKRSLYKIFRHERAEQEQVGAWLQGDPPFTTAALARGRTTHTHCRRGHPLEEGNLATVGPRRTCLMCRRMTDRVGSKRRYHARKLARGSSGPDAELSHVPVLASGS